MEKSNLQDWGKNIPTETISFDSVELSMEEEHNCIKLAHQEKVRSETNRLYGFYILQGLSEIEAANKAGEESENIEVSETDLIPFIKKAKEDKYYRQKTNDYFARLKEPKNYVFDRKKYIIDAITRFKEETKREEITEVFNNILNYFVGGYSTLDINKGLCLMGGVGTGKTTIMNIFQKSPNAYRLVSCRTIAEEWKKKGSISEYSKPRINNLPALQFGSRSIGFCFDDLGTEIKTRNYGDELNVMEEIILNFYDTKKFNKIHITTNLNPDEIEQKYGVRVRSRMREMFNLVKFEGGDLRK